MAWPALPFLLLLPKPERPVRHRHAHRPHQPAPWPWYLRAKLNLVFIGGGGMLFGGSATIAHGLVFSGGGGMLFGGTATIVVRLLTDLLVADRVTSLVPGVNADTVVSTLPLEYQAD